MNPDIRWFKVLRRLQSVSRGRTLALISITVLIDQESTPLIWSSPKRLPFVHSVKSNPKPTQLTVSAKEEASRFPDDIKVEWAGVLGLLKQKAEGSGLCVLRLNVLVGTDGLPISWSVPQKNEMEPKGTTSDQLLELLS